MKPVGNRRFKDPAPKVPPSSHPYERSQHPADGSPPSKRDPLTWWLLVLLCIGIVVIYWRVAGYPFTNWDDPGYVFANDALDALSWDQAVMQFNSYVMGNYHPLTMLSYSLEISFAGKDPTAHHMTNIALHVINCLLVFALLRKVTRDDLLAAMSALLFAVHPMRVETVAWISDRKDLLLLLFGMLTMLSYLKYLDTRRTWMLLPVLVLFLLACLCKGTAVAFAPCLILLDHVSGRDLRTVRPWVEKVPFLILSALFGILAIKAQATTEAMSVMHIDPMVKVVLAGVNIMAYLAQQWVPLGLHARYSYPHHGHEVTHLYWVIFLVLVGCILLLIAKRRRIPRIVAFALLFHVVNIALVLQIISVGEAIRADRYTYIAGIGWAIFSAWIIQQIPGLQKSKYRMALAVLAYSVILGWLAFERTDVWKDGLSVWNDMLADDPKSPKMNMNRGAVLAELGRYDEALADMNKAIRIDPWKRVEFFHNRGLLHFDMHHYREALDDLMIEARSGSMNPELIEKMTYCEMKLGMCDDVIANCNGMLARAPGQPPYLDMRALCLLKKGDPKSALADADRSIAKNPSNARAWYIKGLAALALNETTSACSCMERSADLPLTDPDHAADRERVLATWCRSPAIDP